MDTIETQEEPFTPKKRAGRPPKPDHELRQKRRIPRVIDSPLEWDIKQKTVPKRLEAIFVMLMDDSTLGKTGAVLNRQDLDELALTRNLPDNEKDALVRNWPHFQTSVHQARAIAALRNEEIEITRKAHKVKDIIERREAFDTLTLPERMKVTCTVLDKQLQSAALLVAVTDVEDISTDKLKKDLYKERVNYVKDLYWIREHISGLSDRIIEADLAKSQDSEEIDEVTTLLGKADSLMKGRSFK